MTGTEGKARAVEGRSGRTSERSRLALLGGLSAAAATGGCLTDELAIEVDLAYSFADSPPSVFDAYDRQQRRRELRAHYARLRAREQELLLEEARAEQEAQDQRDAELREIQRQAEAVRGEIERLQNEVDFFLGRRLPGTDGNSESISF